MRGAARRVLVFGVVQGVGFRPFIVRLARRFGYAGWVKNVGGGVEIHIEARAPADFRPFLRAIREKKPPLAVVESLADEPAAFEGLTAFEVRVSRGGPSFVFISPDISVCRPCLNDIADAGNRRHLYPFTNCTNCGPRYTIVKSLPYDRARTTMAGFPMCADCAREYADPGDRRYHAQPIACPVCGPKVRLRAAGSARDIPGGIDRAAGLLGRGRIVAVKGLGGFHLMADPRNAGAVARLRRIKGRDRKPLALMALDPAAVRKYVHISPAEEKLLLSPRRPIVLLTKKRDIPGIAPHLNEIGVMIAYTPLHVLLLRDLKLVVATSSNPKDSPIMKDEDEGIDPLCDYVLGHDRPIHMRADDSVIKAAPGGPLFARRARGFVPSPQRIPDGLKSPAQVLALGGELKDTVTVCKNGYAVTSQFLGDLDEYANRRYFEEAAAHLRGLFDVRPSCVVSDLHPDFHTTRWAEKISRRLGIPHFRVQHHFAHILAVLLEHSLAPEEKVLGVAWDGFGYGEDGTAWGGEFLWAGYSGFERFAHFEPVPLPGGDLAAKEPWRMALAHLRRAGAADIPRLDAFRGVPRPKLRAVWAMLERGTHSPEASSCGRLFDAVSALAGTAPLRNEFEGEAAMRLEAAAAGVRPRSFYPVRLEGTAGQRRLSFRDMMDAILADLRRGAPGGEIAAKFHTALARAILETARLAREEKGAATVALGGGVFLNRVLLGSTLRLLQKDGFRVLRPVHYSPNDESISLGQAAYALARLSSGAVNRSG